MKIVAIAIAFVASAALANPTAAGGTTETAPAAKAGEVKAGHAMEKKGAAAAAHTTECKNGKDAHGKPCTEKPAETK